MTLKWSSTYEDAPATYIAAVEAADGQALEEKVKTAYTEFILGCMSDGIWDAIKSSCILAGARTLNGALVPLVGAAPTNFNFVSGDYDRKTGLVGDGSTKYLDSNRLASADPPSNFHMSVFVDTAAPAGTAQMYIGGQINSPNDIFRNNTDLVLRSRASSYASGGSGGNTGFMGHNRNSPSSFIVRTGGGQISTPAALGAADAQDIYVFARNNNGSLNFPTSARLSFYSIGEALDLALLDNRVSALMTTLGGLSL